jgi:hypothetical protein
MEVPAHILAITYCTPNKPSRKDAVEFYTVIVEFDVNFSITRWDVIGVDAVVWRIIKDETA